MTKNMSNTLGNHLFIFRVAVGTSITRCPPHRSGLEVFPHPALQLCSFPRPAPPAIDLPDTDRYPIHKGLLDYSPL
jgi:hypothetical protein